MLFWIFAIPLILCLAFGIFIRVCVAINEHRDRKRWDIDDYDERKAYVKKYEDSISNKVETGIAGNSPEYVTWIVSVLLGIVVLVMSICIIDAHVGVEADIAANKQIYASLVYQYENDVYDDDDDVIGKKQLYDQIQEWNKDLAKYRAKEKDFWVGIFYPNIFDQFEFIEYK
jgi:uncharacterized protein with PQ loop repeat